MDNISKTIQTIEKMLRASCDKNQLNIVDRAFFPTF